MRVSAKKKLSISFAFSLVRTSCSEAYATSVRQYFTRLSKTRLAHFQIARIASEMVEIVRGLDNFRAQRVSGIADLHRRVIEHLGLDAGGIPHLVSRIFQAARATHDHRIAPVRRGKKRRERQNKCGCACQCSCPRGHTRVRWARRPRRICLPPRLTIPTSAGNPYRRTESKSSANTRNTNRSRR